jgi:glutaredoxin
MLAALVCLATPAWALYKVVGPDGRVTYTDRPPNAQTSDKVTPFRAGHAVAAPEAAGASTTPAVLRQPVSRHPATLYTSDTCQACEGARLLLRQRGVPFSERRVSSDEDLRALVQIVGDRTLPALSLGQQLLKGFNDTDWHAYLDAAGYPKESRLPANWKPAPALSLAESVKSASAPASAPQLSARTPAPPSVSGR